MSDESEIIDPLILLVTANVGSLFEDTNRLLEDWINEFVKKVSLLRPQFLALHLQEVGGKTYEKSEDNVALFLCTLKNHAQFINYRIITIYLDENFKTKESFTALGSLYFAHITLSFIKTWNFATKNWEECQSSQIFKGNIESIETKEKSKFPQHFYPDCKWSRKGFMRTRWDINGTVFDLINIHLFHDASNLIACQKYPSIYCTHRHRALLYTLEKFHSDKENGFVPYFIFGDFNFRCDTNGVLKELTEDLFLHRIQGSNSDDCQFHYKNLTGKSILTVGKKEFKHESHQSLFRENWLKKYDRELNLLNNVLFEYAIQFSPTYPFEENPIKPEQYMLTRCPSWCDRILLNSQAMQIICDESKTDVSYNTIGDHVCMGDHKPVFLQFRLRANQGILFNSYKLQVDTHLLQQFLETHIIGNFVQGNSNLAEVKYVEILQKVPTVHEFSVDDCNKIEKATIVKETKF